VANWGVSRRERKQLTAGLSAVDEKAHGQRCVVFHVVKYRLVAVEGNDVESEQVSGRMSYMLTVGASFISIGLGARRTMTCHDLCTSQRWIHAKLSCCFALICSAGQCHCGQIMRPCMPCQS
jgi:hypothetical protein